MKKSTHLIVACLFAIISVSAQDTINSIQFSGYPPHYAMVGGKAILSANLNIADSSPANMMFGIIKRDADGNAVGQPVAMKIIHLTDVAPYTKTVLDTVDLSASIPLSSTLADGQTYAYFCSILSAAYAPIDQKYSLVNVGDVTLGNMSGFSKNPYGVVMVGSKVVLNADLNIADATPANMMFGVIKKDANGDAVGQPVAMKIIHLTDIAPYSKSVADTLVLTSSVPLSSALTDGQTYAYFCSILSAAYSPVDQKYSEVSVVDTVNTVNFSTIPLESSAPGTKVALNVGLTIANSSPANLMIGIIKRDAVGNAVGQPTAMKIIHLSETAPYCKEITDTLSIPAGHPLSSELSSGEKYSYFCSILSAVYSPIDQKYNDVSIYATALQNKYVSRISVYPNPATDKIHISGVQLNQNVGIYNIAGSLVKNEKLLSNSIDVSNLKSGVYFIKVDSTVSKFTKQ